MQTRSLRGLLSRIRRGGLTVEQALERLRALPFEDLGFAKIDTHRELRRGFPEVIFGEGKTVPQIVAIVDRIAAVATQKDVTPGQIALAWTIAQGTTPIPGTRRIKYLEQNAAAAEITLTPADLSALDEAAPVGAAAGDRYIPAGMAALNH